MYCKKGMAIFLTAVCLCMSFSISTTAKTNDSFITDEVSPAYEIGANPTSNLSVSGKTAYCTSVVGGKKAVNITVEQTLEKYSGWFAIWNAVDGASWTETFDNNTIYVANTQSGLSSGTYRLKSIFTLKAANGKAETITVYSKEKTV